MSREEVAGIIYNMYGDSAQVDEVYKIVGGMWEDLGSVSRAELVMDWRRLGKSERALWPNFAAFLRDCMVDRGGSLLPLSEFVAMFGRVGIIGR